MILALHFALAAAAALAEPATTSAPLVGGGTVEWRAPSDRGCPDARGVAALIDEHLGPREEEAEGFVVKAEATERAGTWSVRLQLETASERSERTLSAERCDAAAQTMALAVALAVGPPASVPPPRDTEPEVPSPDEEADAPPGLAPEQSAPPPTTSEPTELIDLETTPLRPNASADAEPRGRDFGGLVGVGAGVTGGHLPAAAAVFLGQGALFGQRWQVTMRGEYVVRRRLLLQGRDEVEGRLSQVMAGVDAGPVFHAGPVAFPLFGGASAGVLIASGRGSDRDQRRAVPWVTLRAGAGLRWSPVPRIALGAQAELSVAATRHTFTFGANLPLVTTRLLAGRGFATVSLRFG